jgi:hypothetical protein
MTTHALDLGTSDVSTPGGGTPKKKGSTPAKLKKALVPATGSKAKRTGRRVHVRADLAAGGALHVRSMRNDGERDVFLDGASITLADAAEAKPVWIQIAKTGAFKGHPAGAFELNATVFDEIIRNFNATENRRIPIDFEHATEADSSSGNIPSEGAPAQGWICDLKVQGGNLWGLVEWLPKARELIRGGNYKFFSPAIRFGARDRVTGKQIGARMTSGALTNNPFLDGMKALVAKDGLTAVERHEEERPSLVPMRLAHSATEYMPQLRYLLRMSDLSTAQEVSDQLDRLREHFDAADQDPDGNHEGIQLASFLYPLRNMLGATLGMTWNDVFDRIEALIADAIGEVDEELEPGPESGTTLDDGGGTDMRDRAGDAADDTTTTGGASANAKDIAMADVNEVTMKLGAVTAERDAGAVKLTAAESKLTAAEAKVADLTLSLKDEAGKREAAETSLKVLKDAQDARDAKDVADRVTLAFDTYKDAQKLTEEDKGMMLIVLKAAPESFEKKYPKVPANQQHLLKSLTETREGAAMVIEGGGVSQPVDIASAAKALSAQRGIPLGEAQRILLRGTAPLKTR